MILGLSLKTLADISAKIQAVEKFTETHHRDIQLQTETFKRESITALNNKVSKEVPKIFKQPTLICPVTL